MRPIASTRRELSACLFREALRHLVWKRQGGSGTPLSGRRWQNTEYGRGLSLVGTGGTVDATLLGFSENKSRMHRPILTKLGG